MAKKLKDLGGKKWEKYSSIKSAQEAGSIYYSKGGKKMAAVLKGDLGKGQSLRSFMNKQLKAPTKKKIKVEVKDGGQVGTAESGNPKVGPGNRGMREPEITVRKLSKTRGGRGDGFYETMRRTIDRSKNPETVEQKRKKIDAEVTARQEVTRRQQTQTNLPASLPPSVKKLKAFKAGTLKLDQTTAFRLIKSLKDYNEKNPKNKVIIPKKLIDLGRM
tara:strand:+ start:43 stop:693 length:651 start_codon:yes stop_codon:yes gene_type:complete